METTWNDVVMQNNNNNNNNTNNTKKKKNSSNNGGKLSLASLMPAEFQSILSKANNNKKKNRSKNGDYKNSFQTEKSAVKKMKLSSTTTTTTTTTSSSSSSSSSSSLANPDFDRVVDLLDDEDKDVSTSLQTPSTHRIYMTPDEITNGSNNLSLQMCWMRPNLNISDTDIEKLILPSYSYSLGETFKFQTIPSDANENNSKESSMTVEQYLESLENRENYTIYGNDSTTKDKNRKEKNVNNNENSNNNMIADVDNIHNNNLNGLTSANSAIVFNHTNESFAMDQEVMNSLRKWNINQWRYIFSNVQNDETYDNTVSFDFHSMSVKQRRLFFQHISTSSLADYLISTPPKDIANGDEFQDIRDLLTVVVPYTSYLVSKYSSNSNNIINSRNVNSLNFQQLKNIIRNFNWWKLGSYGRQIEMDIMLYFVGK